MSRISCSRVSYASDADVRDAPVSNHEGRWQAAPESVLCRAVLTHAATPPAPLLTTSPTSATLIAAVNLKIYAARALYTLLMR